MCHRMGAERPRDPPQALSLPDGTRTSSSHFQRISSSTRRKRTPPESRLAMQGLHNRSPEIPPPAGRQQNDLPHPQDETASTRRPAESSAGGRRSSPQSHPQRGMLRFQRREMVPSGRDADAAVQGRPGRPPRQSLRRRRLQRLVARQNGGRLRCGLGPVEHLRSHGGEEVDAGRCGLGELYLCGGGFRRFDRLEHGRNVRSRDAEVEADSADVDEEEQRGSWGALRAFVCGKCRFFASGVLSLEAGAALISSWDFKDIFLQLVFHWNIFKIFWTRDLNCTSFTCNMLK